jgi:hypothetical protein
MGAVVPEAGMETGGADGEGRGKGSEIIRTISVLRRAEGGGVPAASRRRGPASKKLRVARSLGIPAAAESRRRFFGASEVSKAK